MKPGDIKRGVQRGVSLRKAGSAPDIGRVSRMYRPSKREGRTRGMGSGDASRERRYQARRLIVAGWSFALILAAAGTLVAAFVLWIRPMWQRERDTSERDRLAADERARKISIYKSPSESTALKIVQRALTVRDPAEVSQWVRLGPVTPEEVLEFFKELYAKDGRVADKVWLGSVDKNGLQLEGVEVIFGDGEFAKRRLAILIPDQEGEWRMDFAAFARLARPSWKELMGAAVEAPEGKPVSGEVRVYFAKDPYFNGPFMDETKWVAYGMVTPDLKEELMVGYCKRGSAQQRALDLMLSGGDGRPVQRATLEVKRVPGSEHRQFEITRVLAEDWVVGDLAFDEF